MLSHEPAKPRDVLSLQNWVNDNACLARDETEYLTHCSELISVASPGDGTAERLEAWIESKLVYFSRVFGKVWIHALSTLYLSRLNMTRALLGISQETHSYTYSPARLQRRQVGC
jgi:hypothetical protein